MLLELDTSIEFLKNIGPERAKLLNDALGIRTVEDFLFYFPFKFTDKTKIYKISELQQELSSEVLLKGRISALREVGEGYKRRLTARFQDEGGSLELVWFRYKNWLIAQIPTDREVLVYGKPNFFNHSISIAHPEIEIPKGNLEDHSLMPVYSLPEKLKKRGFNQAFFLKTNKLILAEAERLLPENLPEDILNKYKLMPRSQAFEQSHFPKDLEHFKRAEERLKFEEAFYFQLTYALKKQLRKSTPAGIAMPAVGDYFNDFYENHLPFQLTAAQKRVLKEIRADLKSPIQMNRLLQGDVGSGKTMVALLSMLIAMDNGYQSVLMAPTEILAQQHHSSISELLKNTGIETALLTGSTKNSARRGIFEELKNGALPILIGTHAVLEDPVEFHNLGLAVIDEQHRFGVAQRARLWAKNSTPPNILIMSATPIPRTLAMSFYSDLDVSVIDELPAGRKPVLTVHRREQERLSVYRFASDEIRKGRQVYFVYPLIEESETLDYKNLTEGFAHIQEFFNEYNVAMLHGRMRPDEKEEAMQYFASGNAQILVATTVIEVGVNVPNASVMIIESAERFGLSQLHQLRGRVGRGAEQSYCILMTSNKLSQDSRTRIKTMCETNDGFRISEMDMRLRGPGNILGTQQSGTLDFKKLDLVADAHIMRAAKKSAERLLEEDPLLLFPKNMLVKNFYHKNLRQKNRWGRIS